MMTPRVFVVDHLYRLPNELDESLVFLPLSIIFEELRERIQQDIGYVILDM